MKLDGSSLFNTVHACMWPSDAIALAVLTKDGYYEKYRGTNESSLKLRTDTPTHLQRKN
jgi:hypothetical protein